MKKIEPLHLENVRVEPHDGGTWRVVTVSDLGSFIVGGRLAKQSGAYPADKPFGIQSLKDANDLCKRWQTFLDLQKRGVPKKVRKAYAPLLV